MGEFRFHRSPEGIGLITFGPRDLREMHDGLRPISFALTADDMLRGNTELAGFLNASLAYSHGDISKLEALVEKSKAA